MKSHRVSPALWFTINWWAPLLNILALILRFQIIMCGLCNSKSRFLLEEKFSFRRGSHISKTAGQLPYAYFCWVPVVWKVQQSQCCKLPLHIQLALLIGLHWPFSFGHCGLKLMKTQANTLKTEKQLLFQWLQHYSRNTVKFTKI